MIDNVLILVALSTLLPLLPLPSGLLAPLPLAQLVFTPNSAFQHMNLTRLHTDEDAKQAFKQSLRRYHPDRGGSQEIFQQIQGLKKIMLGATNYYDLYNMTEASLAGGVSMQEVIAIKEVTFNVQMGIFYFITMLYILAFTLEDELKIARRIMLSLTVVFLIYELRVHYNPHESNIIDFINPSFPLFLQQTIYKRTLAILIAVIRTIYLNRESEEKKLLRALQKEPEIAMANDMLERLNKIYMEKVLQKQRYEQSWIARAKKRISQLMGIVFILMLGINFLR